MAPRRLKSRRPFLVVLALWILVVPLAVSGQEVPRTPWGDPNLQGVWDFGRGPRLRLPDSERSADATRNVLLPQRSDPWGFTLPAARGITLPSLTPEGEERRIAKAARVVAASASQSLDQNDRCIIRNSSPVRTRVSNNFLQILQTPDHVAIVLEMAHEAVIVPLA